MCPRCVGKAIWSVMHSPYTKEGKETCKLYDYDISEVKSICSRCGFMWKELKVINGKRFIYDSGFLKKNSAYERADSLRSFGYYARVLPAPKSSDKKWIVWKRKYE